MDKIIARFPPNDGREWECQCARCGSSMSFIECPECGGEGLCGHDCGEDCCCCLEPEDNIECPACSGVGSFPLCLSASSGHCAEFPNPGREVTPESTVEWYCIAPTAAPE